MLLQLYAHNAAEAEEKKHLTPSRGVRKGFPEAFSTELFALGRIQVCYP